MSEGGATTPRVSIGLPVYNGENYTREAIEDILSQTFTDFELIISDNASTDGTEEICRGFAAQDGRVRYIRHPENLGAAFNFNHCVDEARAPFFKWHAHDDGCKPTYLASCMEAFDGADDSVVLCQCRSTLIDDKGSRWAEYGNETRSIDDDRPHRRLGLLIEDLRLCTYVFGVMRTDMLRTTRMIDSFVSSDVVLLVEVALRGKIVMVQNFDQLRRVHDESSRLATNDAKAVQQWFDPKGGGLRMHPRVKYGLECVRSIAGAPLSLVERARCSRAFVGGAIRRRRAPEAKEREQAHADAVEGGARAPYEAFAEAGREHDGQPPTAP